MNREAAQQQFYQVKHHSAPRTRPRSRGMAEYRKKPVVIEAVQYDGSNLGEIQAFVGGLARYLEDTAPGREIAEVYDRLHDTWVKFGIFDWIIRGVQGEHYPCVNDVFESTYDRVDV